MTLTLYSTVLIAQLSIVTGLQLISTPLEVFPHKTLAGGDGGPVLERICISIFRSKLDRER